MPEIKNRRQPPFPAATARAPGIQGYHPARMIIADTKAPRGLAALAYALRIILEEWKSRRFIVLPASVTKDGYVQLLITIREIGGAENHVLDIAALLGRNY